jgi:glycosyltransferase involved in cell wall biosynthesis
VPLVSILAPSYNHEAFLPACLESVRAQTWEDWELVLVDDGSRDGSVEAAGTIARKDPRIRVLVNQANLGTYGTEQRALEESTGALVAVLNTDDVWQPDKLASQIQALRDHPQASHSATLGCQIDREGKVEPGADVHGDWPREGVFTLLPWLIQENRILASSVIFRREGLAFETKCRYSGDWVALIDAGLRGPCALLPEPLTQWRVHGGNAHFMSPPRLAEEILVREWILRRQGRWGVLEHSEGRRRSQLALLDLIALYLTAGEKGRALRLLPKLRTLAGLKRLAGAALPRRESLKRLWPESWEQLLEYDLAEVRTRLSSSFRD